MERIKKFYKTKLSGLAKKLPFDKLQHLVAGAVIFLLTWIFANPEIALAVGLFIGLIKEVVVDNLVKTAESDPADWFATAIGTGLTYGIVKISQHFDQAWPLIAIFGAFEVIVFVLNFIYKDRKAI